MDLNESVTFESTSSALDQLLMPSYSVVAGANDWEIPIPELNAVKFPLATPPTQESTVITLSSVGFPEMDESDVEFPAFRHVGRIQLKVRNISRMTPPEFG